MFVHCIEIWSQSADGQLSSGNVQGRLVLIEQREKKQHCSNFLSFFLAFALKLKLSMHASVLLK